MVTGTWCAPAPRRRPTLSGVLGQVGYLAGDGVQSRSAVGVHTRTVGHQLTGVLEGNHAVAEQAPALLWERGHNLRGIVVDRVRRGAGGLVLAHDLSIPFLVVRGVAPHDLEWSWSHEQ